MDDRELAEALSTIITKLPVPDYYFAESLLRAFRAHQAWTEVQREYAQKFVDSTKTTELEIPSTITMQFPNLCKLLTPQKFTNFHVGKIKFALKRDGSIIWVMYDDMLHGMIDTHTTRFRLLPRGLTQFQKDEANNTIFEIEADPEFAAKTSGILTGRCSLCGRTLTDENSIKLGIGPTCLKRAGWQ